MGAGSRETSPIAGSGQSGRSLINSGLSSSLCGHQDPSRPVKCPPPIFRPLWPPVCACHAISYSCYLGLRLHHPLPTGSTTIVFAATAAPRRHAYHPSCCTFMLFHASSVSCVSTSRPAAHNPAAPAPNLAVTWRGATLNHSNHQTSVTKHFCHLPIRKPSLP
jgi:hypothetical protein